MTHTDDIQTEEGYTPFSLLEGTEKGACFWKNK